MDDIGRLLQELMRVVSLTVKVGVTSFAVDEVKSQPFQLEVLAVGVNKVAKDKPSVAEVAWVVMAEDVVEGEAETGLMHKSVRTGFLVFERVSRHVNHKHCLVGHVGCAAAVRPRM